MEPGGRFDLLLIDAKPGLIVFRLSGPSRLLEQFKEHEGGGHRFQRVPPTEKRGRVQTSTITVCCLAEATPVEVHINERDLEFKTCRGSGAGGQHRNVTDSAVQLTHKPTGLTVRVESGRSQHQNKDLARTLLRARLLEAKTSTAMKKRDQKRRKHTLQSGRAEKRRTIRMQADHVLDHITGRQTTAKKYMRGQIESLWS